MDVHLAIDLGAESGRVIAVWLDGGAATYHELNRFGHRPVELPSGLHWNITQIWSEIVAGLRTAAAWAASNQVTIVSVGADTWGVDWALVSSCGELLGLPHAYRDPRNPTYFEQAMDQVGGERIYRETGIQLMPINSLYSLMASMQISPGLGSNAAQMLFIPDLIHYWLSGVMACEQTIASTSQMLDSRTGRWATELLDALKVPTHFLSEVVSAGTGLGCIRDSVARTTGLSNDVLVITPGSHDTASAVAAMPACEGDEVCFLSSGTWSLLGCELPSSLANEAARAANFTNEAGVGGTTRFLKNIAGLWLVQECRRQWEIEGQTWDYPQLTEMASESEAYRTLINPAWGPFQSPGDMPTKMVAFAEQTKQPVPKAPGEFIRCALESLALAYGETIDQMETIVGKKFLTLHIVGGGCKNSLLNQLTADCAKRTVIAGPAEATALGNGLVQAMSMHKLESLSAVRAAVRAGTPDLETYNPTTPVSPDIVSRFRSLLSV